MAVIPPVTSVYKVVAAKNATELEQKVNEAIAEGYAPQGGPAAMGTKVGQAMIMR